MITQPAGKAGVILPALMIYTVAASAAERQLDAHDHGHSRVNIALSGNDVLIELISPAANVIGFEHAPKNEDDHALIDAAVEQFGHGDEVFLLSDAAQCVQQDTEIESSLLEDADHDDHHDEHDDDAHDDHHDEHDDDAHDDHHDEHDDDAHDDHHDEHDDDAHDDHHDEDDDGHDDHHDEHDDDAHGDHEGESHSEFHVTWAFSCSKPEQLKSIDVKLFALYSGFEEIDVSLAGDNRQDAYELTPESTRIDL